MRGLAIAGLFVTAASLPLDAGGPDGPVGDFGGRSIEPGRIRILDLAVPAIRSFDRTTLRESTWRLAGAGVVLDPYGFAATGDGTVWLLGGKGRFLLRFSEDSGALIEKRALADPGQGVLVVWGRVGLIPVRLRPDEPLLLLSDGDAFRSFSTLASRRAPDLPAALIRNLFRSGSGAAVAIPFWFTAGPAEVLLLSRDGGIRRVAVPSFALPSPPSPRDPGGAFTYPVRDVFATEDGMWVLTNQEGDRSPLAEGARRGLHVVLVREGRPNRVADLAREARAILDASLESLVLLFADGSISRVPAP